MAISPWVAQRYVGRWVHCHSVYGFHRGILTRVLPNGIVLTRAVQLASGEPGEGVGPPAGLLAVLVPHDRALNESGADG
ncbi:MAG: hypothetical protein K6V36_02170, partial [Anaerolineae bacterium]|nr:hypothetical protein [Anaerolineae bacterium]